jgi:filamentous hemagglutinin family protein
MRPARQAGAGPHRGLAIAMCIWPAAALAGAVTDGSVGAVQQLSGQFVVPQTLGTVKGGNLFHSFASFGVASSESATFTTSSASIRNVIARVTGGQPSAIYGPLSLQAAAGSRPDFFFINPAGVLFGAGAQIDVPGGFHVSTAQQLKFADGFVWDTGSPTTSGLTVAAPEAFGFLRRSSPAAVRFTNLDADGVAGNSPSINLPAGSSLTIAAGTVELEETWLSLPSSIVQLAATGTSAVDVPLALSANELGKSLGGVIRLSNSGVIVDAPGIVVLRGDSIDLWQSAVVLSSYDLPADTSSGAIYLRAGGNLSIRQSQIGSITNCDATSGLLLINAGTLDIDGTDTVLASKTKYGSGHAGAIDIVVDGAMTITNGATVGSTSWFSSGHGGPVSVKAGSLIINGHGIYTVLGSGSYYGSGNAGSITVDVSNDMILAGGGAIISTVINAGDSGNVVIKARNLDICCAPTTVLNGIAVVVINDELRNNKAGSIDIDVRGALTIRDGSFVGGTSVLALGDAGRISMKAKSLRIEGNAEQRTLIDSSALSGGNAGPIRIKVTNDLTMPGNALIESAAFDRGNAGSVEVSAGGIVTMANGSQIKLGTYNSEGSAGVVSITADSLQLDGANTLIDSSVNDGPGEGGRTRIEVTHSVALTNGATISSTTSDGGDGGRVWIKAADVSIAGSPDATSRIMTDTLSGTGGAGDIAIRADQLFVGGYGKITSSTASAGSAGMVDIGVDQLTIDATGTLGAGTTGIFGSAAAGSSGQTGHVQVRADDITLRNGGILSLRNDAIVADPAALVPSTLSVSATNVSLDHAEITAASTGNAGASNIDIAAVNRMTLKSSSVRTSAVDGDGGSIRLAGNLIRLTDSLVTTSVEGQTNGNGGNIDITGNALVLKSGFIQANTQAPLARGGNININTRLLIPEGGRLVLGGARVPFGSGYAGLNVIQAAADGIAGDLQITTPELNLAGTLSGLATPEIDFGPMARDQCRTGAGSSFTLMGSGALPASVADQGLFGR